MLATSLDILLLWPFLLNVAFSARLLHSTAEIYSVGLHPSTCLITAIIHCTYHIPGAHLVCMDLTKPSPLACSGLVLVHKTRCEKGPSTLPSEHSFSMYSWTTAWCSMHDNRLCPADLHLCSKAYPIWKPSSKPFRTNLLSHSSGLFSNRAAHKNVQSCWEWRCNVVGMLELAALQDVLLCAAVLRDICILHFGCSLPNDTVFSWKYLQVSQQWHEFVIKFTEIPITVQLCSINF